MNDGLKVFHLIARRTRESAATCFLVSRTFAPLDPRGLRHSPPPAAGTLTPVFTAPFNTATARPGSPLSCRGNNTAAHHSMGVHAHTHSHTERTTSIITKKENKCLCITLRAAINTNTAKATQTLQIQSTDHKRVQHRNNTSIKHRKSTEEARHAKALSRRAAPSPHCRRARTILEEVQPRMFATHEALMRVQPRCSCQQVTTIYSRRSSACPRRCILCIPSHACTPRSPSLSHLLSSRCYQSRSHH